MSEQPKPPEVPDCQYYGHVRRDCGCGKGKLMHCDLCQMIVIDQLGPECGHRWPWPR